jgi:hypothetical protein
MATRCTRQGHPAAGRPARGYSSRWRRSREDDELIPSEAYHRVGCPEDLPEQIARYDRALFEQLLHNGCWVVVGPARDRAPPS